jgi:hypothetical protein
MTRADGSATRPLCQGVRRRAHGRLDPGDDAGSTTPLILGFFLLALLVTGGAVALSDAATKQRDLQSTCDGAAIAAANSASAGSQHGAGLRADAIPLDNAETTVAAYLDRDPDRRGIRAQAELDRGDTIVRLVCMWHTTVAFGPLIGRPHGIVQTVHASARSPLATP